MGCVSVGLASGTTLTSSEQTAIVRAYATKFGLVIAQSTATVADTTLTLRYQATSAVPNTIALDNQIGQTLLVIIKGAAVTLTVASTAASSGTLTLATTTPATGMAQGTSESSASIVPFAAGAAGAVVVLALLGYVYYRKTHAAPPQLSEAEVRQKRKEIVQTTAPAMPAARTGFQRFRDPDQRFTDEGSSGPPKAKRKSKAQQQVAKAKRKARRAEVVKATGKTPAPEAKPATGRRGPPGVEMKRT